MSVNGDSQQAGAMEALGDHELCLILSNIPFSRCKVKLQAVSRGFRRALACSESYSCVTFPDDEDIKDADPSISEAVWAALSSIKGSGELVKRLIGANVRCLRLSHMSDDCPVLARVVKLELQGIYSQFQPSPSLHRGLNSHCRFAEVFPSLQTLTLGEHGCTVHIIWTIVMAQLERLPTLRTVRLYFDEVARLPTFCPANPDCELHLSVGYSSDMRKLPSVTASCLVSLSCWMQNNSDINLAHWQHLTKLRSITVALQGTVLSDDYPRSLRGMEALPVLQKVMVYSIDAMCQMPLVRLTAGWSAHMTDFTTCMSSAGLFSIGRNQLLTVERQALVY